MLKKILCVILTVFLVLSVAACSNKDEKNEDSTEKTENGNNKYKENEKKEEQKEDEKDNEDDDVKAGKQAATGAAEEFLKAYCDYDLKTSASFLDDAKNAETEIPFKNKDDLIEKMLKKVSDDEDLKEYYKPVLEKAIATYIDVLDYDKDKINCKSIDLKNGLATVTAEIKSIDIAELDFTKPDIDVDSIVKDLEKGGKIKESMKPEEKKNAAMKAVAEKIDTWVENKLKGKEKTKTEEITIDLVKKDDKWLVKYDGDAKKLFERAGEFINEPQQ